MLCKTDFMALSELFGKEVIVEWAFSDP